MKNTLQRYGFSANLQAAWMLFFVHLMLFNDWRKFFKPVNVESAMTRRNSAIGLKLFGFFEAY